MNYLVVMYDNEDEYWDTSGHRQWKKDSYFLIQEFDIEVYLINSLGRFLANHPNGEFFIYYRAEKISCDDENILEKKAWRLANEIIDKRKLEEKHKREKEKFERIERIKNRELAELKRLKEKYDKSC